MKPTVPIALLCLFACAAPVQAAPAALKPVSGERVGLTLDACHADSIQTARYATFGAQMSQIKGGKSMAVRFDLYQRNPGARFRRVAAAAPGFGVWHPSAPAVGILRYSQEVANLPAPASFRVTASYRWLNAHNRTIKHAHRISPVCVLPDERPDLVAGSIILRPGSDTTTIYDVVVRNEGLGAAGAFGVGLSVAGQALPEMKLAGLAPAGAQVLSFSGPKCATGSTVTASVDPEGAINERTKADDVRSITC